MRRNLILYSILLLSLAGVFLFLSSNYIDSSNQEFQEKIVQNLFQADKVKLRVSFSDTKIKFSVKSEMLNSLANSNFMKLFQPEIYLSDEMDFEISGNSNNAFFYYKTNLIEFKEIVNFSGSFKKNPFSGSSEKMIINFSDNTLEVSKNLKINYLNSIYSADSIKIDLSEKLILDSSNIKSQEI